MTRSKHSIEKASRTPDFKDSNPVNHYDDITKNPDNESTERVELSYLVEGLRDILRLNVFFSGTVFVCDEKGGIVFTEDGQKLLRAVPGHQCWLEQSMGTNAIGRAIRELQTTVITGKKHQKSELRDAVTIGVPVLIDNRLIGCVGFLDSVGNRVDIGLVEKFIESAVFATKKIIEARKKVDEVFLLKNFLNDYDENSAAMVWNANGTICQINKLAEIMLGMPREELIGSHIDDYLDDHCTRLMVETALRNVTLHTSRGDTIVNAFIRPQLFNARLLGWSFSFEPAGSKDVSALTSPCHYEFSNIIGNNKDLIRLLKTARRIADSPSNILVSGESGTGKELVVQAIHRAGSRCRGPFVPINCSAIPKELMETELFGYAEGAFTGAKKGGVAGKFVQANGGTLFLDEIGDMPYDLQPKLLRAIQERQVIPIGGNKSIPIDIRLICASNQDLEQLVAENRFRADLYYRLNVITLQVPALRERKDDIPILADYFIDRYSRRLNKPGLKADQQFIDYLADYSWPGNVRELENIIERAVNLANETLTPELLPSEIRNFHQEKDQSGPDHDDSDARNDVVPMAVMEKQLIQKALIRFEGNISQASSALGIGRTTLYRKIKKFGLTGYVRNADEHSDDIKNDTY
jgi:sigma-54 dependent transcriptional regulator, acetoin dehydrogenase operon transcriptional activator AcoR